VATPNASTRPSSPAFAWLVQNERLNELDAEHWISRWEREAEVSGRARDNHYWSDAWDWIAEHRQQL
jgi:hypothetical protein